AASGDQLGCSQGQNALRDSRAGHLSEGEAVDLRRRLPPLLLFVWQAGCAPAVRQAQIIYMAVATRLAPGNMQIEIKRSFLEDYKNRVTIRATFTVDDASGSPNPREFDGDLHVAG